MRVEFKALSELLQEMIEAAVNVKSCAYAPVTGYHVGAALIGGDKRIYKGCNVEISSMSPSICAERNAIFSYFASGGRKFSEIAVCGDSADTFPCGVCRQVIYELSPECNVYVVNSLEEINVFTIKELLPNGFKLEEL